MALAVNPQTLTRVYSMLTTAHFYEVSIFGSLGSRNYEAALQSAYSALVQTESFGTTVADRTRAELHSGFVTPTEPSTTSQTIVIDQAVETAQDIPMLDRLEGILGASLFDRATREAAVKMGQHVDAYFMGLITGANFKGSEKFTLGSNANYINFQTGLGSTEEANRLVIEAARRLKIWAVRKNLTGIQIGGPSLSDLYMVVQPELASLTDKAMLDSGVYFQGTAPEVRQGFMGGIMSFDETYVGRVLGVDIFATPQLDKPASASANWKSYAGVRQGVEYAARPINSRYVSAETRESGGWVDTMGSMMQYGGKVVNSDLLVELTFDSNPAGLQAEDQVLSQDEADINDEAAARASQATNGA